MQPGEPTAERLDGEAVDPRLERLERFNALTSALEPHPHQWRWLGAIAVERALGRSILAKMDGGPPDEWLDASVARGLLVSLGPSGALSAIREVLYGVDPDLEQLVLRRLAGTGELADVAIETHSLLQTRSVADLTVALQCGDLKQFLQRVSAPRRPDPAASKSAAEWLRGSVCEPFDATWLQHTWRGDAVKIASRVLRESLDGPSPCAELAAWLRARLPEIEDDDTRLASQSDLCQHAILRGDLASVGDLAAGLPSSTNLGYGAAARFLSGDLPGAQRLLGGALAGAKQKALQRCGAVAPLLALVLAARGEEAATAAAKRLLAAGTSDGERGAARAFRTLLRYLGQPSEDHRRIHVQQLGAGAGAWEILLSALTVHLHLQQPVARGSWAQHLVRKAIEWREAGYAWLGDQTLLLANDLSAERCAGELEAHGLDASALPRGPRELSLWDLIAPKPEWKKTLEALARVSDVVSEAGGRDLRAAWYLDMRDGSFSRPALQEYRAEGGSFSQQRLSISELHAHRHDLPLEDRRILDCTQESITGERELTPEAYEVLIGHPRVFNGMRGQAPVEVVRGVCRVETEEAAGHIRVLVEPEGAELGINVVPDSETRLTVYRVTEAMRRVIEVLPRGARIPKAHEAELLRVLAKLAQSIEVRSPELGAERRVEADATPCLRFSPTAGAWSVQLGVRPFGGRGRFFFAGLGRPSVTLHADGQLIRCERDLVLERTRVDALIAECPSLQRDPDDPPEDAESWVLGEEAALALLSELRAASVACALEWPESAAHEGSAASPRPPLELRGSVRKAHLKGRLRSRKGWYIATGGLRIDEVTEIALNDLARAPALAGGRFLRLPDGGYVEVEERMRRVMAALRARPAGARDGAELRIHPGAVTALRDLAAPESGFDVDQETRDWLDRVERAGNVSVPVPDGLRAELRPYQVDGFRWLCRLTELGLGACLADDMGLGKTLQILALLLTRTGQGPALVVAPTSVCSNWAREIQRFAPSLVPVEYFGKDRAAALDGIEHDRTGKVVITSYALLQQDEARLCAVPWGTAVLDEAQLIKNADTLRARAAFRLSAGQRIAATGTPVENHFGDLWSIFQFLNPGLLGASTDFMRRFVRPVERGEGAAPEAELRQLVQPYVLRRLKQHVLPELPPVTEVTHEVHLSPDDALRYALLRRRIHDKLFTAHGKQNSKIEVLAEITRLRRFCCHPRLVFPDADSESAKIQAFLELVEELRENQHRALVFSQYVDFLSLVREQLDERAVTYEYLDGSTPQGQRQSRVDAFQNGDASLFLISLKAGGFGLNLTAADYVIHLDPWWNPAVEAQATDRAHRIGQERRVTVYRLVTKDTIEEKMIELHEKKERLAKAVLEGGELAGKLSLEELVQLIEGDSGATAEGG